MDTLIVIPARYGSTRFPGKPLVKIAGKEMLLRVYEIAQKACKKFEDTKAVVATDDERIKDFCNNKNIDFVMTSKDCKTGTDRVKQAVEKLGVSPNFVVNLQGDNPLCPPWFLEGLINKHKQDEKAEIITPCAQLSWQELDDLRKSKQEAPFSGTTAIVDDKDNALWFSKNIIPAIRKEQILRKQSELSPVFRHVGLYGYKTDILFKISSLKDGYYEKLEGLEQLRFIENNLNIKAIRVDYKNFKGMSGIDSPQDVPRAEEIFKNYGEF